MKLSALFLAILSTTFVTSPVWASQTVNSPFFDSVGLSGSGTVDIRYGATQSIIIREGSAAISDIRVRPHHSLEIRTCRTVCPAGYRLAVDIVTPDVKDLAISGSGRINVGPGFGGQSSRDLAVSGSGTIDSRSLVSDAVEVAVSGSGIVRTGASRSLQAAINGSGRITYRGNPAVTSAVSGSGRIGQE
jgi:hypothetical protein